MFRNSAALFLLGGTITHRPKDKATENALHSIVALLNHSRTTTKWRAKTPWLDVRGQTPHLLSWEVTPLFLKPKVETLAVKMRTSMTLSLNPTFHYCKDTTFSGIPTHWSVNLLLILVFSFVVSCFWCIFAAFKIKSKDKIQIDIIAYTCSRSTAFVGIT